MTAEHTTEINASTNGKVDHTRLPSVGFWSWSRLLAVSLQVTRVINPAVGYYYFPPGPQLLLQPWRGLLQISLLGEQRHVGCEQFAYDCYPTASRLRFEPRPYCVWVQHANHSATKPPQYISTKQQQKTPKNESYTEDDNDKEVNNLLCRLMGKLYRTWMLYALFSVSICVLCFLLWAASYDGLMPSLAACHCNNWYVYVMYMCLVNKLSLSLSLHHKPELHRNG